MTDNNEQNKINDCVFTLLTNADDYMWVNFTKPCGYSIMHPFLRNDSVQALYRYLDHIWTNTNILIWFQHPDNPNRTVVIERSLNETLRSFLHRHRILRSPAHTSYTLHFDTQPYAAFFHQAYRHQPHPQPIQVPIVCPCHHPDPAPSTTTTTSTCPCQFPTTTTTTTTAELRLAACCDKNCTSRMPY
jgi:hypothetical protein